MTVEAIDVGDIAILIALTLGIISLIVIILWQTSRSEAKYDRLDAKLDSQRTETSQKIDALRSETSQKFDDQRRETSQKFDDQRRESSQEHQATRAELSRRVSDVELAQARQDGVNSVLQNQTHTHETLAD